MNLCKCLLPGCFVLPTSAPLAGKLHVLARALFGTHTSLHFLYLGLLPLCPQHLSSSLED